MNANHFAIIVYGVLTIVLCYTQAAMLGSSAGMMLALAAAGMTYAFQAGFERVQRVTPPLAFLWAAIIVVTIASGVVPHVLR